jgi:hypothetical protein
MLVQNKYTEFFILVPVFVYVYACLGYFELSLHISVYFRLSAMTFTLTHLIFKSILCGTLNEFFLYVSVCVCVCVCVCQDQIYHTHPHPLKSKQN